MVRTVKPNMVRTSTSVGTMIVLGSRSVPISRGSPDPMAMEMGKVNSFVFISCGNRVAKAKAEDGIGFRERESRY